jgi:biotin synthase
MSRVKCQTDGKVPSLTQKKLYNKESIIEMLKLTGAKQKRLFAEARANRHHVFEHNVIIRGVIEITNICRMNCDYCPMRKENTGKNNKYLMKENDIIESAGLVQSSGIDIVFLQGGETPKTTKLVGEIIPKLKKLYHDKVEILISLGVKQKKEYRYLKEQGADSYILKHETSDPVLFEKLRHELYQHRFRHIKHLLDLGYRVGTGTIVGLPGQSLESIADDILLAKELNTHMSSASPFMPAPGTPLAHFPHGSLNTVLNAIAVMRLVNPGWLIPSVSALEKLESGGQLKGLQAGANVLTINFTPHDSRKYYSIYGKNRYIVSQEHVQRLLEKSGLSASKYVYV